MTATTNLGLTLNGRPVQAAVEPRTSLADFLRDRLRFLCRRWWRGRPGSLGGVRWAEEDHGREEEDREAS